jgi:hypothetical protein
MDQKRKESIHGHMFKSTQMNHATVFRSAVVPLGSNAAKHTSHGDVIGPFKTTAEQHRFVLDNPSFVGTVADAERAARS